MQAAANQVAQVLGTQLRSLKDQTFNQLTLDWLDMDFHNKRDIEGWLSTSIPTIDNAFDVAIETTATFADLQVGLLLDDPGYEGLPVSVDDTKKLLRNGAPLAEIYTRPFVNFWDALKDGKSIDDALHSGANRIRELLDTDVERLSDFTSVERFANSNRVVGHRRVLVGPKNCALCIVASTQRYRRGDLKPIHPHCDCKVAPVFSWESDGAQQVLDEELLDQLHASISEKLGEDVANRSAKDYNKIMVVHQHGENGPYLGWRGQHFASASGLTK